MSLYLGIDIGTTSIATAIIDKSDLSVKSVNFSPHNAYIKNENGIAEQDVNTIISIVDQLVNCHPLDLIHNIKGIGVAGQMHGILLWNKALMTHSNLITWQDRRASTQGILEEFQKKKNCSYLRDGFGLTSLATIYYNQKENKNDDIFNITKYNYDNCGTIMDYLVWLYTGCPDKSVIDYTNAASWGLFDIMTDEWDSEAIKDLGINLDILPKVLKPGSKAGELCSQYREKYQMNSASSPILVKCALGDNQSSVVATGRKFDEELYITFGTGTQLSIVINKEESANMIKSPKYELRPFPFGKLLVVAAPLSGGKSWELLKDLARDLFKNFDVLSDFSDGRIYEKLDKMALSELDSEDLPQVLPHFQGERWDPNSRCTISNIDLYNFKIGKIAAGLLIGMANNLKENIPAKCFENRHVIIGNGTFIRKSEALRKAIEKVFGLPVVLLSITEESATGAAILAME